MTEQEILREYEKKLNDMYIRANTKSKKKRIVYDLFHFSSICYEHFNIEKNFIWEQDEEMLSLIKDIKIPFTEYVIKNKEIYNTFSKSVLNTFLDIEFPFYEDYCKLLYYIPTKETKEIIFSFLDSYDPKLKKIFKEKIENNEIFNVNLYTSTGYAGICYPMSALKRSFIFYENMDNSIFSTANIIHEFGHAYEYNIMDTVAVDNWPVEKNKLPYTEVSSRFLEYAFLNYLKENKIYSDDVKMCLIKYYKNMLKYIYDMHLICETEYLSFNKYGYIEINDTAISQYANKLKEHLNYYTLVSELGEEINFRNSFIYGIGSLLSIYLYENYKQDPNHFKKEFRNALINYQYNGIDAFQKIGVTEEKIIKGQTLKKVLTNI